MKVANPIIPGFAPDPTIVVVNGTYILVNSSFHVFPGLPIYSSTNLVDWELRGHALSRPSQLSLSNAFTKFIPLPHGIPLIITGGLFAPTLRHFGNKFYLVCTYAYEKADGGHEFQNFLLSCQEDSIFSENSWSDAVPFQFPGIDPGLFFDETSGKAYVHGSYRTGPPWAPDCSIRQFQIDVETGEALSECKFLWKGASGKNDAEGPHIYFKDGWYYLLTAESSTFEGHQINIASQLERTVSLVLVTIRDKKPETLELGLATFPSSTKAIELRIQAKVDNYEFIWRTGSTEKDNSWQKLGDVDPVLLSGYDMTGTLYGIFAIPDRAATSVGEKWATFKDFHVE
ncbi:hypothetical protein EsH8_III_000120 [Colletotrichum jinshuiense]